MDSRKLRGVFAATASLSMAATAMLVTFTVGPASASPSAPTASALGFNIFAEGDAVLTSNETEGPVALGGDLTIGGNYQVGGASSGTFVAPGDTVPSALVIGGAIDFAASAQARLQVQGGAYAKVGDLSNADVRNTDDNGASVNTRIVANNALYDSLPRVELTTQQPIASVGPTTPINFATAFADFRGSSTTLAGCLNTVTLTNAQGQPLPSPIPANTNAFLTLANGVTNVLNISATDLSNISILTFQTQPSATAPLLINVNTAAIGNTFAWTVPNQAGIGAANAPYLLWNFPTATAITQTANSASLEGTLYAPNAALTDLSASNNEGQVIVASIVMGTATANGGEVHYFPFAANLTCAGQTGPALATDASDNTTLGGQISDTATLSGGQNPTGTIIFALYGPNNANCAGTPNTSPAVNVNGNGSYTSASFTPAQAGIYRWVAIYSGDANNPALSTACNDANEIVFVRPGPVQPGLVTDASDDITLGGQISDTATLSGLNPSGTITFRLYGPDNATCASPAVFTSTLNVDGNGIYTSASFTPARAGVYRWTASYSGDADNQAVTTPCNDDNESVTVGGGGGGSAVPTLVTRASRSTTVGQSVFDMATLSGGQRPTGTITFNLYGPDDSTCSRSPVFTSTVVVSGNGNYRSGTFRPSVEGTFQWVAGYSGDANNDAVQTNCGDPDEQVVVNSKKPRHRH